MTEPHSNEADRPAFLGMIWAQTPDGIIGDGNGMPWHLPEDLAHFKAKTMGAPVIMGRRTWDSLNPRFRPLPGRRNIVLSRTSTDFPGADHATSLNSALSSCADEPAVWIIGGGRIYREGLPYADECVVTEIDVSVEIDTPVRSPDLYAWEPVSRSEWLTADNGLRYRFTTWRPRQGI
ncbi:dihydrofolate reductase [Corynebacterium sp. H78]|uniref:dihydrofolate reductase n=1 Tax=Corynebacterium sp. H78 TaxID=3133417 RepID=UPI003097EAC8